MKLDDVQKDAVRGFLRWALDGFPGGGPIYSTGYVSEEGFQGLIEAGAVGLAENDLCHASYSFPTLEAIAALNE